MAESIMADVTDTTRSAVFGGHNRINAQVRGRQLQVEGDASTAVLKIQRNVGTAVAPSWKDTGDTLEAEGSYQLEPTPDDLSVVPTNPSTGVSVWVS